MTRALAELWRRHGQAVVLLAVGVMAVAALARLTLSFRWLLFDGYGGPDLYWYRELTRDWFAGASVYHRHGAVHPPALFLLFWPIYGWLSGAEARWLYAGTTALATVALIALLVREARAPTRPEAAYLGLLVLAGYPLANTIANGQATAYVLAALVGALVALLRMEASLRRDLLAAALLVIALTKPNLSAAFLSVALFATRGAQGSAMGGARAVALAVAGYLAATAVSVALHGTDLVATMRAWYGNLRPDPADQGYGNFHAWLTAAGRPGWRMPASAVALLAHGAWTYRRRAADPWALIGVAAVVARIAVYHRAYDDLLLVLPVVALYRVARSAQARRGERAAAGLLVVLGSLGLARAAFIETGEPVLVAVWLLEALFLAWWARRTAQGNRVAARLLA
jgi:hypothetical protein